MPNLAFKNEPVSAREIGKALEFHFRGYLKSFSESADRQTQEGAEILKTIFSTRHRISDLLKAEVDFKWDSDEKLTPQGVKELCQKITFFSDKRFDTSPLHYEMEGRKKDVAPYVIAGRELLQDERIDIQIMRIMGGFGRYLQNVYLQEQTTESDEQISLMLQMQALADTLIRLMVALNLPEDFRKKLVHSLIHMLETKITPQAGGKFLAAVQMLLKNDCSTSPADGLMKIESLFKQFLPECWHDEIQEEKVKLVVLGTDDVYCRVVPMDNFCIADRDVEMPSETGTADAFPPNGQLISARDAADKLVAGHRDVSVFTANGKKVFWGDLLLEDIADLTGTYYVLSQTDSYHQVPKCAILAETLKESEDQERPDFPRLVHTFPRDKVWLDTEYIRLMALGKIQSGIFTKNPQKVSVKNNEKGPD